MNKMKLRVKDVFKDDLGKGIARIDPEVVLENNLNSGDIVCIFNDSTKKSTAAITFQGDYRDKGTNIIRIDANLRRNLNASIDDIVRIKKIKDYLAQQVSFAGYQTGVILKNTDILAEKLKNRLVSKGDIFLFFLLLTLKNNFIIANIILILIPKEDNLIMSEIKALGLYRRAMSALKKEKYDKALKLLDQSLSFNPEDDNT